MWSMFRKRASTRAAAATPAVQETPLDPAIVFRSTGRCPVCERETAFEARNEGLRDFLLCVSCASLPRERALMHVLTLCMPRWREMTIHESSPAPRGASLKLATECPNYVGSQYLPDPATRTGGVRHEDLEALTFDDESLDLHVTQDVMEHIFHPTRAFAELGRTLRPGGLHAFTVPLVRQHHPTLVRARLAAGGEVEYLEPAEYHGNPVGDGKALVTLDWGFDICDHIARASGLHTTIFRIEDVSLGITGYYTDVLVSRKFAPDAVPVPIP